MNRHRVRPSFGIAVVIAGLAAIGCNKTQAPAPEPARQTDTQGAQPKAAPATTAAPGSAKIGSPAPDFELSDTEGKTVKLSSLRGNVVVLEWFNPECPYVKKSHTKGSLVDTAKRHSGAGVTWLAINSGAPGKQGHGVEKNREAKTTFGMGHPVLIDEDGLVGKAYGAKRTPHMYVIDKNGVLVYAGAIDNSPDGEGESPSDGKLVNYVDTALADIGAGRAVAKAETEAYGCSVKYR
jgi:peroxiredoxin